MREINWLNSQQQVTVNHNLQALPYSSRSKIYAGVEE